MLPGVPCVQMEYLEKEKKKSSHSSLISEQKFSKPEEEVYSDPPSGSYPSDKKVMETSPMDAGLTYPEDSNEIEILEKTFNTIQNSRQTLCFSKSPGCRQKVNLTEGHTKVRLQRSTTYADGDETLLAERIPRVAPNPMSGSQSKVYTNSFESHVAQPAPTSITTYAYHPLGIRPPRTSRLSKMRSLQRSRTTESKISNIKNNIGYKDYCPIASDDEISSPLDFIPECSSLALRPEEVPRPPSTYYSSSSAPPSTEKIERPAPMPQMSLQSMSVGAEPLINKKKRSQLDVATQFHDYDASRLQGEKIGSIGTGTCKTDSHLPSTPLQSSSLGDAWQPHVEFATANRTSPLDGPRPINAAAVADGHLEDIIDPTKQSTSSFLKEQFFAFFQPSDNKLAMKLFGSKSALNRERKRQQQEGKWIIHPCSSFRFYWDLIMLILLIANLIILPVAISFFNDDLRAHWIIFNSVSDAVFIADIAVKFRTGVIANDFEDEIILDPKEIARRYVRSWFLLDLISSIPMDYIFWMLNKRENYNQILTAGRTLRILRLAKLLSILRLLRLTRLVRYVSQWEEFLNIASKFMGIFNLVLLMLLLGHWNACLQFLIPLLMAFPEDSWVQRCKLKDADWFEQYTWALFKAMSHMLSIGYGRFPPTSISEAWITIVSMMTGATCYALFVGHAAALIQSFDTSKRLYREKFKQVEEYMAYRKLPRALRQRIADYYEHRYQRKMFDEAQILAELSECLREQIINYNCRELVAAVPFFTYADPDFVSEVVTNLKFEVFQPGDLIIKEGTIGTKMYFIQEGMVDIITKDGEVATTLSDGSYFGEICLLTNAKRVASVRAVMYSNLYSLDRDSFVAVLNSYPLMRRTMESVAAERLSKIGQNPAIVSSREDLTADLSLVKEIVSSVVTSDESDTSSEGKTLEITSKDDLSSSRNKLRWVIGKTRKNKGSTASSEKLETVEEDSGSTEKEGNHRFLSVPKPQSRKRSSHRTLALSGVSKLFQRGGVFGEHTDDESEAYLFWDRERQKRRRRSHLPQVHLKTEQARLTAEKNAKGRTHSFFTPSRSADEFFEKDSKPRSGSGSLLMCKSAPLFSASAVPSTTEQVTTTGTVSENIQSLK
ncbi:unnamed protein product [Schistocephalus solidus]|uniref:Cyclic nucleotide-binding domain-containing protein n=1 Tax=Schistocephalus solidus TaxID=70667 RepID=A0A3P7DKA3_SCHSO|nr:unnamed protein product [Schistocephalus solidus]